MYKINNSIIKKLVLHYTSDYGENGRQVLRKSFENKIKFYIFHRFPSFIPLVFGFHWLKQTPKLLHLCLSEGITLVLLSFS